jgi:hypothetical protein
MSMIRVTLDIRTNLDPGTLYLLIWQLILKAHPFRDVVLVAGSAETVEPVPVVHPEGTEA